MRNYLQQQDMANVGSFAGPMMLARNPMAAAYYGMGAMQGGQPNALAMMAMARNPNNALATAQGYTPTIDDGDPRRGMFSTGASTTAKPDDNVLAGVNPDLIKVVQRAREISGIPFVVTEGVRSLERQRMLYNRGSSQTMNSRHLTGNAVDIAPLVNGSASYDWQYYYPLSDVIKQAARDVGVDVEWGGDWKSFKDGPHWQIAG